MGKKKTNSLAVAGFVTGIVSLFINFCGLVGLVATVLSAVGLSQIKSSKEEGKGMAITGLILGIIGVIYGLIVIMVLSNS